MKKGIIAVLVLLALTVFVFNYQFYNIPRSMYLNARKLDESEVPNYYLDVTEDGDFRTRVIDYVTACNIIRTGMKIEEYEPSYDWLNDGSKNYDMIIKYFDDYYFLQVRYHLVFLRTTLEYTTLWVINIITVVACVLSPIKSLRLLEKANEILRRRLGRVKGKKMRAFTLMLVTLMFASVFQMKSVHASSAGYERYKDDESEIYFEFLPIVPFDPAYPTASEEWAFKFHIWQNCYWTVPLLELKYPAGFNISVYYRCDSCGDSNYATFKTWYPTSVNQYGWTVTWSLSGSWGPLDITTTVAGPDVNGYVRNYDKFNETYEGKTYLHVADLSTTYRILSLFGVGPVDVYGGGSVGIPNDLATAHEGHHVLIWIHVDLLWYLYDWWSIYPRHRYYDFVLGDDDPAGTDCWLTVEQGNTQLSETVPVYRGGGGGGGGGRYCYFCTY
jgi:hypothetical protein